MTFLAASTAWPDGIDGAAILIYALIAFGIPLVGYVFLAIDVRRYLRSLRRALVVMTYAVYRRPTWSADSRPPCMEALDLYLPVTEEQVLAAYRSRVKELHPDRGGDLKNFLRLQKHFEQAMYLARNRTTSGRAP